MPIGECDHGRFMEQEQELQPLVRVFGRADEGKVEPAGQQPRQQADGLVLDQLHRDVGPLLAEIVQQHRQKAGGGAVDCADANGGRLLPAADAEFGGERIGLRQKCARVLEQNGAVVGQRDAARGPRHQPCAEVLFEQPDKAAERRGQHFKPLRRPAEMQFFGRRHETSQLMKIHRSPLNADYIIFLYKRQPIESRRPATQGGLQRRTAASATIASKTPRRTQMREYSIAAIPADGIGPEVIAAGTTVLESLGKRIGDVKFNIETFDWGSAYYRKHGAMMPADGLAKLKKFDAIYFGAVGAPDVPDHITLWGLRLPICQGFDQYANVRPTRILPGITSPLR